PLPSFPTRRSSDLLSTESVPGFSARSSLASSGTPVGAFSSFSPASDMETVLSRLRHYADIVSLNTVGGVCPSWHALFCSPQSPDSPRRCREGYGPSSANLLAVFQTFSPSTC